MQCWAFGHLAVVTANLQAEQAAALPRIKASLTLLLRAQRFWPSSLRLLRLSAAALRHTSLWSMLAAEPVGGDLQSLNLDEIAASRIPTHPSLTTQGQHNQINRVYQDLGEMPSRAVSPSWSGSEGRTSSSEPGAAAAVRPSASTSVRGQVHYESPTISGADHEASLQALAGMSTELPLDATYAVPASGREEAFFSWNSLLESSLVGFPAALDFVPAPDLNSSSTQADEMYGAQDATGPLHVPSQSHVVSSSDWLVNPTRTFDWSWLVQEQSPV